MDLLSEAFAAGFKDDEMMIEAYKKYSMILMSDISILSKNGNFLDLTQIPEAYKDAFIRWMIFINKPRITKGLKPAMDIRLALKCPIWKLIKPPFVSIKLTKEEMFKPRTPIKSIGTSPTIKNINSK